MKNLLSVVIGAGLMGHGITLALARYGHQVAITDPDKEVLQSVPKRVSKGLKALGCDDEEIAHTLNRIKQMDSIADSVLNADIVIEAAPENLLLKQKIFAEVEKNVPEDAILASNTSVIPISEIMGNLKTRHRTVGTHWWNPPHIIPLVEVVKNKWTENNIVTQTVEIIKSLGKTPVVVQKDIPGFIGNRLQHAMWREAISLVENGVCDAEAVDTVVKSSFGSRLAVLGPLENADMVGTDLTLDIHRNLLFDLEQRGEPSPYLSKLVEDGSLGMKSGKGFRSWTKMESSAVRTRLQQYLIRLENMLDSRA